MIYLKYIQHELNQLTQVKEFTNLSDFHRFCVKDTIDGLWLEFGVWTGASITLLSKLCPERIHGFDSFEGLPEDWVKNSRNTYTTDFFKLNRIPSQLVKNKKIELHVGWFYKVLPRFVKKYTGNCAVIHIDCDLYSSTKTVFDLLQDQIVPGTIIIFDELYNYENFKDHEMKCLLEQSWHYEYIARTSKTQACIRIKE